MHDSLGSPWLERSMPLTPTDLAALAAAKQTLEHPSLVARISSVVGAPFEWGLKRLPESWMEMVSAATHKALETALKVALSTLNAQRPRSSRNLLHKALVTATGAGGGAFGLGAV